MNATQINFHQSILMILSNSFIYPFSKSDNEISTLAFGILAIGIPAAIAGLLFISAIILSKNTGIITMMIFLSVVYSYILSIFRYNESQNLFCSVGVLLIIGGLWKVLFSKK